MVERSAVKSGRKRTTGHFAIGPIDRSTRTTVNAQQSTDNGQPGGCVKYVYAFAKEGNQTHREKDSLISRSNDMTSDLLTITHNDALVDHHFRSTLPYWEQVYAGRT